MERGGRRGKRVKPDPPVPFFVVWEASLGAGLTSRVMDLQPEPAGLGASLGRAFDVGGRTPARGSRPRPSRQCGRPGGNPKEPATKPSRAGCAVWRAGHLTEPAGLHSRLGRPPPLVFENSAVLLSSLTFSAEIPLQ